jgi:putative heme-binding domain-containing protein
LAKDGGKSFAGYIRAIRQDAIARLETVDVEKLTGLLADFPAVDLSKLPQPKGPPVGWTVESAMKLFGGELRGRDFSNGQKMFSAGLCIACHRVGGEGGYSGPDLGSVGSRYSIRDILVSICEPSATLSEQYMASRVTLKDGEELSGRLLLRNDKEVAVALNPFDLNQVVKVPAGEVESIRDSQISVMPAGMIGGMNPDELMDLVAYLLSGGNPQHNVFK